MNPYLFALIYRNPQQKLLKTKRFSTVYIYVKCMMFCMTYKCLNAGGVWFC